jgi:hypothetical protein
MPGFLHRASANATSRPSALDITRVTSGCSLVTTVPSGSMRRTHGGQFRSALGRRDIDRAEIEEVAPLARLLAPATFPVDASTTTNCRSPTRPGSVTSAAFNSSPIIDFTE